MKDKKKKLTTSAGAPVPDNQNVMTAGPLGPTLLQDVWFLEKLAHFDREVIPERRMHAKGSGAYGTFTVTHGSTLSYEPNSYGEWQQQPEFAEPPLSLEGAADHWNHRTDDDYYSQPGKLFRLMSTEQQKTLFGNTARAMGDAPKEIKIRHINNCLKADPAYGEEVAKALGILLSEISK